MVAAPGFDLESFHERAVRTPSDEDVGEMRDLLCDTLREHGVEPRVDEGGNVLAARGASDPTTHLVLNTHIDTVPPHVPYERDGEVVRGRGSCDAKGPLAAILAAFLAYDGDDSADGDDPVDDGPGVRNRLVEHNVHEQVAIARETEAAAHAAEPASGVNAVAAAEGALSAIRAFDAERDPHPDLGPATLTPTVIAGGEATNQVPADCAITVDRRSVPPETADGFASELERAVDDATPDPVGVDFAPTERPTPFLEAFATDPDSPVVRHLSAAAKRVTDGAAGTVRPFTAATEASYFSPAPTVVFGPGVLADDDGPVAHADREYVRVAEVERAATALTEALDALLG